jgi:hypothetical protein
MDVLAALDMPAWAALLGLIGECPSSRRDAASRDPKIRAVSASTSSSFPSTRRSAPFTGS